MLTITPPLESSAHGEGEPGKHRCSPEDRRPDPQGGAEETGYDDGED